MSKRERKAGRQVRMMAEMIVWKEGGRRDVQGGRYQTSREEGMVTV
jgi:hypothetical protein